MCVLVIADDIWHPAEVVRPGLAGFPAPDVILISSARRRIS